MGGAHSIRWSSLVALGAVLVLGIGLGRVLRLEEMKGISFEGASEFEFEKSERDLDPIDRMMLVLRGKQPIHFLGIPDDNRSKRIQVCDIKDPGLHDRGNHRKIRPASDCGPLFPIRRPVIRPPSFRAEPICRSLRV